MQEQEIVNFRRKQS